MTDHVMLARVFALEAEVNAVRIEANGMLVANMYAESTGGLQVYTKDDFQKKADELRGLVCDLQAIGFEHI